MYLPIFQNDTKEVKILNNYRDYSTINDMVFIFDFYLKLLHYNIYNNRYYIMLLNELE